ncbi:MAG: type IV pilus modification protein PilV [Ferrimonas sp.]
MFHRRPIAINSTPKYQSGFTFLELLIAVLVIAIAMLGYARLQVGALQQAREARFSQLAYNAMLDLSDRIRSEATAARNGEFTFDNLSSGAAPSANNCTTNSCSRSEFAQFELQEWFNWYSDASRVPALRFQVAQPESNLITIQLRWDPTLSGVTECSDDGQAAQCVEMELWMR